MSSSTIGYYDNQPILVPSEMQRTEIYRYTDEEDKERIEFIFSDSQLERIFIHQFAKNPDDIEFAALKASHLRQVEGTLVLNEPSSSDESEKTPSESAPFIPFKHNKKSTTKAHKIGQKICRFFSQGIYYFGSRCHYIHKKRN